MVEKILVAVIAAAITGVLAWIVKKMKEGMKDLADKIDLLMFAQQQGLRHDLMDMYDKACRWNCISNDDAELFEAMYKAYHSLGKNGVMDSRHDEILDLRKVPYYGYIEKEEKEKQNHNK